MTEMRARENRIKSVDNFMKVGVRYNAVYMLSHGGSEVSVRCRQCNLTPLLSCTVVKAESSTCRQNWVATRVGELLLSLG